MIIYQKFFLLLRTNLQNRFDIKLMNSRIFDKVLQMKSPLSVDDLSPDEKKLLYALMVSNGATKGFTYDRFFQKGFLQWELDGVDTIKRDFLKAHEREMLESGADDDAKGYAFALSLDDSKGGFYRAIGQVKGLRSRFKDYMRERGMQSDMTIINRFTSDDWKPYERRGIRDIIEEYIRDHGEKETRKATVAADTAEVERLRTEPVAAAAGGV